MADARMDGQEWQDAWRRCLNGQGSQADGHFVRAGFQLELMRVLLTSDTCALQQDAGKREFLRNLVAASVPLTAEPDDRSDRSVPAPRPRSAPGGSRPGTGARRRVPATVE